jgi:hypothetical protein
VREVDGHPARIAYRVTNVPVLDDTVSTMIGDAVHNLRSAFDHLAYQLVLLDGQSPTNNTYFPMHGSRLNKKGNPRNITIAPGINRADIRAAIEAVQPYHQLDPWDDELFVINQLDIADKHHLLLVAVIGLDLGRPGWWGLDEGVPSPKMTARVAPLKSSDVVARFDFQGTPAPPDFDPHITLAISLDEGPPGHWLRSGSIVDTLHGIRNGLTHAVINWKFVPLFPGEIPLTAP